MYIQQLSTPFWILLLGGVALAIILVSWMVARSSARNAAVTVAVPVVLASWAVVTLLLASRGIYHVSSTYRFPFIGVAIAAPLAIGYALMRWTKLGEVLRGIPPQWLIGIQTLRIEGAVFLVIMAGGQLPAVFALPAGIGDTLVGAAALLVVYLIKTRGRAALPVAIVWNVAGLFDLVSALSIGFLASTSPFRAIFSTPTTDLNTTLPLVTIPVFLVPLFILVHVASLQSLARLRAADSVQLAIA